MEEEIRTPEIVDDRLLCKGCFIHMVIPIYVCDNGHNFCEDCMHKCIICIVCTAAITERNEQLETLSSRVLYHCKWNARHCGTYNYADIRRHEFTCRSRRYDCPAICEYYTYLLQEMFCHFREEHPGVLFRQSNFYRGEEKEDKVWYMLSNKEIFTCRITFDMDAVVVRWSVALPRPYCRVWRFQVELDLGDMHYVLTLCDNEPRFVIEFPYSELPPPDDFDYTLWLNTAY